MMNPYSRVLSREGGAGEVYLESLHSRIRHIEAPRNDSIEPRHVRRSFAAY